MANRTYPFSAFPNAKVANENLKAEIEASSIMTPVIRIDTVGTDCIIVFDGEPSGAEDTTLNGLVAAHSGLRISSRLLAPTAFALSEVVVTELATWQVIGQATTNPGAALFQSNIADVMARIVGQLKSDGTGTAAQIRLVENDGASDVILATLEVPDTDGAWEYFELDSQVGGLRASDNLYRLEARLNAFTTLSIKGAQGALVEVIVA